MGTSTNAMLMYGYNLGNDDRWYLEGTDEYGGYDFTPHDWYDEDDGLTERIEAKLLAAHGFTETDWRADGYFERKKAAQAAIGVTVEAHCSGDYPMYVLAAKNITASRGDCETVDFAALDREVAEGGYDEKLRAALAVLGLTPTQDRARWLLCSYWG